MLFSLVATLSSVFIFSFVICFLLIKFPLPFLRDVAGDRSLHTGVIPRSGGLAILIAYILGFFVFSIFVHPLPLSLILGAAVLILCGVSLLDDLFSLSPLLRLLFQLIAVGVVVFFGKLYFSFNDLVPTLVAQVLTTLGFLWMINLYNFMDGMDGFASGMALIGFTSLAILGYLHMDYVYASLNVLLVVSVLGFWCWNFPPAKIFMGDAGSTLLGFLAGVFSMLGWQRGLFPIWVPAILFSAFWVDATYTLLLRALRGERVWQAHRSHIYQRLVLKGWSHKQVVLGEYLLMLLCSLSVLLPLCTGLGYNLLVVAMWTVAYGLGIAGLEARLFRKNKT